MFLRLNKFFSRLDVKLTTSYTLILLVLAVFLCSFFYYRLEHNLGKQVDRMLRDELNEFMSEIKEELKKGGTIIHGCEAFEEGISKRKYFPLYFRLLNSSGGIVFQAAHIKDLSFPSYKKKESFYRFKPPGSAVFFRIYEKAVNINDDEVFIFQLATEMKQAENLLENFLQNIFRAIPAILFLSIVCGIYVSRKPRMIIRNITSVAKKITSQNMNQRLEVPIADDEVRDLIVTINEMMNRLERSFKHTRQFTADVSHELRNPLFALKGEMEVILSQKRGAHEYREAIYECHERVDFLIKTANDLFMISRFDENKIQMELDYLNINDVVQNVYDLFLPMAEEKNIALTVDLTGGITLLADNIKLSQVVSNLVDNAIKFTLPNGRIDISAVRKNNEVELRVKDNGEGIPEGKMDRIFDRFYQVDASRSGQKGTGLGLQICKRIIEAHNGRIRVEKNRDKGATFIVWLPVNE